MARIELNRNGKNEKSLSDIINDNKKRYFIKVPLEVIEDKKFGKERVALFCYLYTNVGMNNRLLFSLSDFYDYLNCRLDKNVLSHKDRWQKNRIKLIMDRFREIGFIKYEKTNDIDENENNQLSCKGNNVIRFYRDYVLDYCEDFFDNKNFAIIYLDELEIIMSKKEHEFIDKLLDKQHNVIAEVCTIIRQIDILLVFAYLRANIVMNIESDAYGKKAEAFDCYFKDIAKATGLKEDKVSDIVSWLKQEGLIYFEYGDLIIYQNENQEKDYYRWNRHIFTNTYKRAKDKDSGIIKTIKSGKNYYLSQIEKKREEISEYLTKNKR